MPTPHHPEQANLFQLAPTAWRPDPALIPAAEAGRIHAAGRNQNIDRTDRAWLIAQLTHRGHPAHYIADKLHCSLRLIKSIRAEPIAVLTAQLLRATSEPNARHRKAQTTDTATVVIANYVREIDQLRESRNTLIDQLARTKQRCTQPPAVVYMPHKYRRHPRPAPQPPLPLFEETS